MHTYICVFVSTIEIQCNAQHLSQQFIEPGNTCLQRELHVRIDFSKILTIEDVYTCTYGYMDICMFMWC